MAEMYLVWTFVAGIAVGVAATWFIIGRLPRSSDDIAPPELVAEAEWISEVIEAGGGAAPADLVEEVLELHLHYLAGPPMDLPVAGDEAPGDEAPRSRPPASARDHPPTPGR